MNKYYYIVTIHNKDFMLKSVIDGLSSSINGGGRNSEVIFVLDGCTDDSENIVDTFASSSGIKSHKIKMNDVHELLSLNEAFRYIMSNLNPSDEDVIVTLQDDVILDELQFETLVDKCYLDHPDLAYLSLRVGCKTSLNGDILCEHDFVESEFGHWKQLKLTHFKELKHGEFEYADVVLKSPTCVKIKTLKEVGIFDETLAPFGHDDLDLCIRLKKYGYSNGVYSLKFRSDVDWGGTRENKNQNKEYHKKYDQIVFRNKIYLTNKHADYYTNNYFKVSDVKSDFNKFSNEWQNTPEYNDFVYSHFYKKVDSIPVLSVHNNYIGTSKMGFGERPFNYLWMCLISQMPSNFKFLEIGVYKGSILCLTKLISNSLGKSPSIYGISPLNKSGDKYSSYEDDNYLHCIGKLYNNFNLDISTTTLIEGYSTDESIKSSIKEEGKFDIVYIDGSHDYKDVVSDIELCDELLNVGGFMVLDDASSNLNLGKLSVFWGHKDVGDAIKDKLESNDKYKHLFACGHNRVFKKVS